MKRWLFHLGMAALVAGLVVAAERQLHSTSPVPFLLEGLVAAVSFAVVMWMLRSRLGEWLRQQPPVALAGAGILIGALATIITFGVMRTPPQCVSFVCPSYAISGSTSDAQAAVLLGGWALA